MSQHVFTIAGETWTVGFDPILASYFAQRDSDLGNGDPVDVAGSGVGEITTVAQLEEILAGQVSIPDGIRAALVDDGPARATWLRPDLALDRITAMENAITQHRTTNQ